MTLEQLLISCTNLVVKTKWSLVVSVLTDVGLAQGGEVEVAALLGVEDDVTTIGCVRKVFVGLFIKKS